MTIGVSIQDIDQMFYLFSKRPTLQYDGLHDRALKHYFSLPEVRVRLTKMDIVSKYIIL